MLTLGSWPTSTLDSCVFAFLGSPSAHFCCSQNDATAIAYPQNGRASYKQGQGSPQFLLESTGGYSDGLAAAEDLLDKAPIFLQDVQYITFRKGQNLKIYTYLNLLLTVSLKFKAVF